MSLQHLSYKRHRTCPLESQSFHSPLGKTIHLLDVPDHVLNEILSFFSLDDLLTLEEVNFEWKKVIEKWKGWTKISLVREREAAYVDKTMKSIAIRHGNTVREVEMIDCAFTDEAMVKSAKLFRNMKSLVLSGCKTLTDDTFGAFIRASTHSLKEVRTVRCPLLSDASLALVNQYHWRTLKRVDFSHCRLITDDGVTGLTRDCNSMEYLAFKSCPKVNNDAIISISKNCPNLRILSVGGAGKVTDLGLKSLATHCHKLESLDIAQSNPFGMSPDTVTDQGLLYFVSQCHQIKKLVLRGQGNLSLTILASLAAKCSNLRSLDIGGCRGMIQDPSALCTKLKRLAFLENLSVSFSRGLKEQYISSIATECPQLKQFDVDGQVITRNNPHVL
jgi:hypothetical protein